MKCVIVCLENLPEKELYFIRNIFKDFEIVYIECEKFDNVLKINDRQEGVLIISSKNFTVKALNMALVTIVYDENEGESLPYGIDLIVGSFEEMEADFLIRLYQHKKGIPCIIAVTERMVLRELCKEDIDEVIKVSRQKHVLDFVEDGRMPENEQREKLLAYIKNIYRFYDYGIWGIFDKRDDALIGVVSLDLLVHGEDAEYEIGFFIRQETQGQGYGSEAVNAVISYVKERIGIVRLTAVTKRENIGAIKLLTKCGFKRREQDGTAKGCNYTFELY